MKILKSDPSHLLLVLIIVLIAAALILAVINFRSNPVQDIISSNRVINVLYVIEDNKTPLSAYVLMYYPVTKRAAIFDIPGDLGLLLARLNRVDRIDRVYDSGRINNYQNEIEKLLGIEINFSIVITKENLVSIVDLLEGIEIFIPSPVFHRDDEQIILFPSGMTILDGDKASLYAVYSLPDEDSDMEIFRRQRFFLSFLKRQIQMNERFDNPSAAKLYYTFFKTNLNQLSLMYLFREFVNIDTERTFIQSVGGISRFVTDQVLIIPHYDGSLIKDIVRQTLASLTRETSDNLMARTLTVEILNGTAVNGLAGRTAEILRSFGYDVISVKNADRNDYNSTLITHFTGDDDMVKEFANVIRCSNIRRDTSAYEDADDNILNQEYEFKADVTLILGRDFDGRFVIGN